MQKNIIRSAIAIVSAWALLNLFALCFINKFMFHPKPSSYNSQAEHLIIINDNGKKNAAFWIPRSGAEKVILYFHGNAEDIGNSLPILHGLQNAGFSVLAIDYPGYGLTDGKPSEKAVYHSADIAYSFLTKVKKYKPEDIVVMGFSIGTGPACYTAEKHPVAGLIFQGGFTSAPRTYTGIRVLIQDPFPNQKRMRNIKCPKLFIHGEKDRTVPYSSGKRVYNAASEPKLFIGVPDAKHSDIPYVLPPGAFTSTISGFINRLNNKKQ